MPLAAHDLARLADDMLTFIAQREAGSQPVTAALDATVTLVGEGEPGLLCWLV